MRRLNTSGAITFIDVDGPHTCPLDKAEMLARFHAREDDGPLLSGAEAFAAMWRAIPLLRPIGQLANNRLVLSLLERLYLHFLSVRPRLRRWLASREVRT